MSPYYYLDVSLELSEEDPTILNISAIDFKEHVMKSLQSLFGDSATSVDVDVLKYVSATRRAVIRVPSDTYVKLHSSLTLTGLYNGVECAYRVHKTAPQLLALIADSSSYEH